MIIQSKEFILKSGDKVLWEYDQEGDLLEIVFQAKEATGTVELTDNIILRFDWLRDEPLSLSIMSASHIFLCCKSRVITPLPLYRPCCQARNNIALHEQIKDHGQDGEDQPGCHVLLDRGKAGGFERGQPHRGGLKLGTGQHDHSKEEFVPGREEGDHGHRHQPRQRQR